MTHVENQCGEELWQFWNVWNQFVCTPAVTGRDGDMEKRWITCWSLTDSIQQLPLLSALLYHRHRCEGLAERGIAMNHGFCFTWHHFTSLNEMSRNVNVGFWTILNQRIPENSAVCGCFLVWFCEAKRIAVNTGEIVEVGRRHQELVFDKLLKARVSTKNWKIGRRLMVIYGILSMIIYITMIIIMILYRYWDNI